ncbi:MauE/DoxX family redox-associated membrane protein [Salinimicrobium sp. TIG7-5_MAKvit]|uniref:MauE/DoxX family redox-associated membrane protein n=1 Tax=Salinimicrobium sp. TIG7-5_MAKvit TaxID=3121289 RepID=UPI003C6E5ADB
MLLRKDFKKVIVEGLSLFFILLFTYAAVNKLQQLNTFKNQLEQFPFVGDFAPYIAWAVPATLITVSVLFFFNKVKIIAFIGSFIIMLLFTLYILVVLNFAASIPCSCAGIFSSWSWHKQLCFNTGMLLMAAVGIALSHRRRRSNLDPTTSQSYIKS